MALEIINYEQTGTSASVYSNVTQYEAFLKMAEGLSKSELVPNNYKGKPENCLIAIDIARQIGAKSPLFVMQNLYIVQGKPSWSGQYTAAIVHANFDNIRVKWFGKDSPNTDDVGCRVIATDKNGNECIGTKITIAMAKAEKWGAKWQTMPEQMLQYRAFAFFARVYCPDKLMGLHDEFEQSDINPERASKAKDLEKKLSKVIDVEIIESEEKE